jgi:hypothetical protein
LWCDRGTFDEFVEAGEATFDGQAARIVSEATEWLDDPGVGFVRFDLAEPFRMPPTTLRFEDVDTAERIIATGWYTLDGSLYRTQPGDEPGTVVLDRVYADPPTSIYDGRDLEAIR